MLFYPAALPLSSRTLTYVAGVIRRHRQNIGSYWRKLSPGRQALLVLAYPPKARHSLAWPSAPPPPPPPPDAMPARPWPCWRPAPRNCAGHLAGANQAGHAYLVIDGTLIPINRVAADRPFNSGKHRRHGMNLQVISAPADEIPWASGPLPGAVHDLTAAGIWGILRELAAGPIVLADKGYIGAGEQLHTPYRGRNKPAS